MVQGRRGFWAAIGVLVLSTVLGGIYGPRVQASAADGDEFKDVVEKFTRVLALIEENYADPVNADQAIYRGAIPGMLRTLDPHSTFFDEASFTRLREEQSGRYYGVGMQVGPRDGQVVVIVPFPGSPAYEAGLRPGDIIHKVDETLTEGMNTSQVATLLKGPRGTVVHVSVLRQGHETPVEVTITRAEIPHYSVDLSFEPKPGIGYVRLTSFNENTEEEIRTAIKQLGGNRLNGLILDLRGNPGGLLKAAVAVSEMFLPKNEKIVTQSGRVQRERTYYSSGTADRIDVPLVILVNRSSASASEIVSGALQDHDRALVVGETTFGKGLVQTVYPLSSGTGMALTTAHFYTPSGRLIQRDYSSVSLYDYFTGDRKTQEREIFRTDGGRPVYGGGGILPDHELETPELNSFQEDMLRRVILYPFEAGVGDFSRHYLANNGDVGRDFEADRVVLQEFRSFLSERNVPFTEIDLDNNREWIANLIKKEVFISVFGVTEGREIALSADPQVQRALDLLPEAAALLEDKRRQVAESIQ